MATNYRYKLDIQSSDGKMHERIVGASSAEEAKKKVAGQGKVMRIARRSKETGAFYTQKSRTKK